ncbi:MAG: NADH-quinone oxidoreductase subunit M [Candidatus Dormibacteria bacterium]|jgi:NADH-quinone oxidoreductase subunit M
MSGFPWLTAILLLPVAGAIVLQAVPGRAAGVIKGVTVAFAAVEAVLVGMIVYGVATTGASGGPLPMHDVEQASWIPAIGASYHLGVDGVSAWILALNAGVFLLGALVVSRSSTERLKLFCGLTLLAEAATTGVLVSLDLLLFYLFWEGMLIPLYFLLAFYGNENRGRATLKFVIYTVAGSLLMLVAILYLHFQALAGGRNTFDLEVLLQSPLPAQTGVPLPFTSVPTLTPAMFAFLAFALAFAIKLPIVPFHTWLPDLYESAPTPVLVFFAGVVSKMGAYGFIRFAITLFSGPVHQLQPLLVALAILSILYGALMALSQVDLKRIVAFASVSHLGFIALGIFSLDQNGINGAIIQIVNHGIIIAGLFLVVGMVEARTGTRDIRELGGLQKRMPWLYLFFLVITLGALGLPGTNGFVGEFTIMLGAFQYFWLLAVLAGLGVVLASWYMLRMHQGMMHEPTRPVTEKVRDLRLREGLVLAPLAALIVFLGVYPHPVGAVTSQSVPGYVTLADASTASPPAAVANAGTAPTGATP